MDTLTSVVYLNSIAYRLIHTMRTDKNIASERLLRDFRDLAVLHRTPQYLAFISNSQLGDVHRVFIGIAKHVLNGGWAVDFHPSTHLLS